MPAPLRRLSAVALVAAGAAGLTYLGANVRSRPAPEFGRLPMVPGKLHEGGGPDAEIERRRQALLLRVAAKDRAVKDLLAGRLTLARAAARFRAAEGEVPGGWGPPRPAGRPDEDERLCRDVLARAKSWVAENVPAAADPVAACLDAELERLRGPDGVVRLPDD